MPQSVRSFDRINIPAPCDANWDSMIGNDRVRFCEHCNLHVTNLSALTRSEATRLVAHSQGRLCVRFVKTLNGEVLTKHLPKKLHQAVRRVSRLAAGAFSATLGLSSVGHAQGISPTSQTSEVVTQRAIRDKQDATHKTATLFGTVVDPNGAVIPAVNLKLINTATGTENSTTSSDEGAYTFDYLVPGDYTLEASVAGFKKLHVREIEIQAGADRTLDLSLEVDGTLVTVGVVAVSVPDDPFIKAAFDNDLSALVELIPTAADINASDKSTDMTALAYAVANNNRDMVHILISAGAMPNGPNNEGQPPLMFLSSDVSVEFLRQLIAIGADVRGGDDSGQTILMNAARSCNLAAVRELVELGARVDARDDDGNTVLMSAAENEDPEVLRLLIKRGVPLDYKNDEGESAALIAVRAGRGENFKALIEAGATISFSKEDLNNALFVAARQGDLITARILLDKGANPKAKQDDTTILMVVAEHGNPEFVKLIVDAGSELDAVDGSGWTAMMHANEAENVRVLLNAGANTAIKNADGETALAMAIRYQQEEIVRLLKSRAAPE